MTDLSDKAIVEFNKLNKTIATRKDGVRQLRIDCSTNLEEVLRLRAALNISPDDVGRIMHESWSKTKRAQGFHHPDEVDHWRHPCEKCHRDLILWEDLPETQKDINRHAFDEVLAEIKRRADAS